MLASGAEIHARAESVLGRWHRAAVEPYDREVLSLISQALAKQERGGDPDDPNDRQVLLLLRQAKAAQEKDIAEDESEGDGDE